jgi:hypothetical protein
MISFTDFKDEKGNIDWNAYRKAQVDEGDSCDKCGSYIFFGKGYRQTCASCRALATNTGEVHHKYFIRCPKCDHLEDVRDDYYTLFAEGEHEVFCSLCDHKYEISTHIEFEFKSPPRIPKEPEEEEVEEEDDEDSIDAETEGGT